MVRIISIPSIIFEYSHEMIFGDINYRILVLITFENLWDIKMIN
jgi:hypothetical protein